MQFEGGYNAGQSIWKTAIKETSRIDKTRLQNRGGQREKSLTSEVFSIEVWCFQISIAHYYENNQFIVLNCL